MKALFITKDNLRSWSTLEKELSLGQKVFRRINKTFSNNITMPEGIETPQVEEGRTYQVSEIREDISGKSLVLKEI